MFIIALTKPSKIRIINIDCYFSIAKGDVDNLRESEFIKEYFEEYDETFTWRIIDAEEQEILKNELIKQTSGNPHLHIKKFQMSDIIPAARHKTRNDVLFILPGGECAIIHLVCDAQDKEDEMHFVFFSSCYSALKYISKQYRTEYLGEKEFVLSSKDKAEISIFALQFILFFTVPYNIRGIITVLFGIILYVMILLDWKNSGFNLIRDRKMEHSKVIPLLRFQVAYVFIISVMLVIGIPLSFISEWIAS